MLFRPVELTRITRISERDFDPAQDSIIVHPTGDLWFLSATASDRPPRRDARAVCAGVRILHVDYARALAGVCAPLPGNRAVYRDSLRAAAGERDAAERLTDALELLLTRYVFPDRDPDAEEIRESETRLNSLRASLDRHLSEGLTAAQLARSVGMSQRKLNAFLSGSVGRTAAGFMNAHKLERAALLLRTTDLRVAQISSGSGFKSEQYFSRKFREAFGCTPLQYRRRSGEPEQTGE